MEAGADLIESTPVSHTDVDRGLFDKLPLESQSSSLSSLVTLASPGISADSNGLFHGFGDHASNSFSVDGQPITDQQSKVFSNQLPVDAVQSLEVIQGAPPAEYGGKTSVVIVVTTRSGLDVNEPHGSVTTSYGSFGSANGGFDLAYGGKNWGNFISANGLNTGRFLDGPEHQTLHDHGNEQNFFDRVDFKPSQADTLNFNFGFTRSWFQTPNSYDSQTATAWSGLVVDNGRSGPERTAGGIGGSALENQDIQHRPDVDPSSQPYHRADVRRLRAAGSIQLLSEPEPLCRLRAGCPVDQHRSKPAADQCWGSCQLVVREGHSQPESRAWCFSTHSSPRTTPSESWTRR